MSFVVACMIRHFFPDVKSGLLKNWFATSFSSEIVRRELKIKKLFRYVRRAFNMFGHYCRSFESDLSVPTLIGMELAPYSSACFANRSRLSRLHRAISLS